MIKRKQPTGWQRIKIGLRAFWIGFIMYPVAAIYIVFESLFSKKRD
jgi:hypothetical protein